MFLIDLESGETELLVSIAEENPMPEDAVRGDQEVMNFVSEMMKE